MPCYNEEAILPHTLGVTTSFLRKGIEDGVIDETSYVLCIDDGSHDRTWEIIRQSSTATPHIRGIKLSRNCGHQNALLAGLKEAFDAQAVVSIDADLQDDIKVIRTMLSAWREGNDVVCGARNNRASDTAFKRGTAGLFYRLMHTMGVDIIPNHADFRLLDRRALDALLRYSERNLFLRGMVPLIGFPSTTVHYARQSRMAGESKYPLRRMIALAIEGITSFSVTPLRFIAFTGVIISVFSAIAILYTICDRLNGHVVRGWASITIAIFFMGGVQMLSLGVIGEYIGKIYLETKRRPRFHIEETTNAQ
ncbi:glycosyltransferase [Acetobacter estunensis NRIC 0472]|nr:glycosyltransferase [Acetobacter estunensis NRIC 0472]